MKPFVYVTRRLPENTLTSLQELADVEMWPEDETAVPREVLLQKAAKADALLTMLSDKVDAELLSQSSRLKVVSNLAVGFDNIDVGTASEKAIAVCNTPDVLTDTTADLAFALLMACGRRVVEAADYIKAGKWNSWSPMLLAGTDIHHKTVGIVGMGRIGEAVAKRALGFDMNVLYHNRRQHEEAEQRIGATYCSFRELLEQADYVVCLTPLTAETNHLFNAEAFQLMKPSAFFINVSRGAVVDEEALEEALQEGWIKGAGLDVYQEEPIDRKHPLLQYKNVIALPHIGSASEETRHKMAELAATNIAEALSGRTPPACVNQAAFRISD